MVISEAVGKRTIVAHRKPKSGASVQDLDRGLPSIQPWSVPRDANLTPCLFPL